MKYFIIIVACLAIVTMVVTGYFIIQEKPSSQNGKMLPQTASNEITSLKSQIDKLQRELNESKDILSNQSLFMQRLKEDILSDSVRIINLEKRGSIGAVNPSLQTKSEGKEQPANPLLNQTISSELFKDPQFARIFQEQVAEALKNIQQQQREEQAAKSNEQLRQRLSQRTEELAKSLNLNESQKQEFSNILTERGNKTIELLSQLQAQQLSSEEYRTKGEVLRNESNEKVKQILSSQQYEQYQKSEPSLFNRSMSPSRRQPFGGRQR
ncbi:MAG: hypothetical protein V1709_04355 [Planctomycetota bacterium]